MPKNVDSVASSGSTLVPLGLLPEQGLEFFDLVGVFGCQVVCLREVVGQVVQLGGLEQLDLRPTTIADYHYKIALLPERLMRKRLSQITPMDVHEALSELASGTTASGRPRAGSTVAQVRTVLGSCLHVAERYGHVTRNAARLAKPVARQHAEVEPLSLEEARALLEQVREHRLGSLFTVALSLGLRQGECVGLQLSCQSSPVNDEAPGREPGATWCGACRNRTSPGPSHVMTSRPALCR
jgi:hypothetical protein